jgi:hypothetical protein
MTYTRLLTVSEQFRVLDAASAGVGWVRGAPKGIFSGRHSFLSRNEPIRRAFQCIVNSLETL